MSRIYFLPDEPRVSEHAANIELVASFDGQTPPLRSAYAAELAEYENSRDYREFSSLMRQRTSVCG